MLSILQSNNFRFYCFKNFILKTKLQNKEYFLKDANFKILPKIIKKKYKTQINIILKGLIKNKIIARQGWELMTSLKHLKKYPKMKMTTAQNIQPRIINLPSSSFILDK